MRRQLGYLYKALKQRSWFPALSLLSINGRLVVPVKMQQTAPYLLVRSFAGQGRITVGLEQYAFKKRRSSYSS